MKLRYDTAPSAFRRAHTAHYAIAQSCFSDAAAGDKMQLITAMIEISPRLLRAPCRERYDAEISHILPAMPGPIPLLTHANLFSDQNALMMFDAKCLG